MKICFNLRDAKAKDKTAVLLIVSHYGRRLKATTGLHISPTAWNPKTNRPKAGQLPHVRVKLNQLEEQTEKALIDAGYLSQTEFKKLMDKVTGKVQGEGKTPYLLAFVRDYCEVNKRHTPRSTATALVNFTLGTAYARWSEIDWNAIKGKDIRFDLIDWNWRQRLYINSVEKGLSSSTIRERLLHVSHFLNASRPGHHTNEVNKVRGWASVKNAETRHTPIALSLDEINRLARLKGLSELDTKIKDLFLIGLTDEEHLQAVEREAETARAVLLAKAI